MHMCVCMRMHNVTQHIICTRTRRFSACVHLRSRLWRMRESRLCGPWRFRGGFLWKGTFVSTTGVTLTLTVTLFFSNSKYNFKANFNFNFNHWGIPQSGYIQIYLDISGYIRIYLDISRYIFMSIFSVLYMCTHIYIYVYTYIQRERERDRQLDPPRCASIAARRVEPHVQLLVQGHFR